MTFIRGHFISQVNNELLVLWKTRFPGGRDDLQRRRIPPREGSKKKILTPIQNALDARKYAPAGTPVAPSQMSKEMEIPSQVGNDSLEISLETSPRDNGGRRGDSDCPHNFCSRNREKCLPFWHVVGNRTVVCYIGDAPLKGTVFGTSSMRTAAHRRRPARHPKYSIKT